MIATAPAYSGKTLTYAIPLLLLAVEAELRLPFVPGEGPVAIVLCPWV